MRDRPVIYGGLVVFLAVMTLPFWRGLASGVTTKGPELVRPLTSRQCVASTEYMRSSHMLLLMEMRDQAVRRGNPVYVGTGHVTYTISLTGTCLEQCHGSKTEFCDRCHDYAGVSPSCWSCHLDAGHGTGPLTASRSSR
jgi:hypothetical protein